LIGRTALDGWGMGKGLFFHDSPDE
jgi:hypothetical protein